MWIAIVIIIAALLIVLWNYFIYRKPKQPREANELHTYDAYYRRALAALVYHYSIIPSAGQFRMPYLSNELRLSDSEASSVIRYNYNMDRSAERAAKAVYEAILIHRQETMQRAAIDLLSSTDIHGMSREEFYETVRAAQQMAGDRELRQELDRAMLNHQQRALPPALVPANPHVRTVVVDQPKKEPEKAEKKDRFDLLEID